MDELATVLAVVFGSEVRADAAGTHTLVRSGDAFFTARIRTSPVAELFVTTRALDGFELKLRCEGYEKGAAFERASWKHAANRRRIPSARPSRGATDEPRTVDRTFARPRVHRPRGRDRCALACNRRGS